MRVSVLYFSTAQGPLLASVFLSILLRHFFSSRCPSGSSLSFCPHSSFHHLCIQSESPLSEGRSVGRLLSSGSLWCLCLLEPSRHPALAAEADPHPLRPGDLRGPLRGWKSRSSSDAQPVSVHGSGPSPW